ncbi:MAG: PilN domain-containing protein [Candidatus Omnitrophota bacterium]|jgi:Tfp pilus assembly protein PilN
MSKEILVFKYDNDYLSVLSGTRRGNRKWFQTFVREATVDGCQEKLAKFLNKSSSPQSCLVLPRASIIQKHLKLELKNGGMTPDEFRNKVQGLLPMPFDQMAHGALFETSAKDVSGVIEALPEEGIEKRLKYFDSLGVVIDDVFCEDQSLFWYCSDHGSQTPALGIEIDAKRYLFIVFNEERLLWSRTFPQEEAINLGAGPLLKEVGLDLLSQNIQVREVLVCGPTDESFLTDVKAFIDVPCRALPSEENNIPHSLAGCFCRDGKKGISLLPGPRKQLKKQREIKTDLRQVLVSVAILMAVLSGGFAAHFLFLQKQVRELDKRIERIHSDVKRVKEHQRLFERLNDEQLKKQRLIECLSDLHTQIPAEIEFASFELGSQFHFTGESPSHGDLSKTIQILEKCGYLKNVTLKQTRLRKKLGKDYFEFEVEASWNL